MMSSIRILAAELAARGDDELRALLQSRPDLCLPPVPDFSALAARACTRVSVQRALEGLNRPELDVLEALVVAGETGRPVSAAGPEPVPDSGPDTGTDTRADARVDAGPEIGADAAGLKAWITGSTAKSLEPLLRRLHSLALLYRVPGTAKSTRRYAPVAAVAEVLGPYHAGLGRGYAQLGAVPLDGPGPLASPAGFEALLAQAPEGTRTLLERFRSSPVGAVPGAHKLAADGAPGTTPVAWLLSRGLLVAIDAQHVELPREVGLAARGFAAVDAFLPAPPPALLGSTRITLRDNAGYGAVAETLRQATELLGLVAGQPVATLRSGGVGVRELKRVSEDLRATAEEAGWLLELTALAGLLVLDVDTSRWTVSAAAAPWLELERDGQWLVLLRAWLEAPRAPSLVGAALPGGGAVNALAAEGGRTDAPPVRRLLLQTLAELTTGWQADPGEDPDTRAAVVTAEAALTRLNWERPRLRRRFAALVPGMLTEAARLGLLGSGALTDAGRMIAAADYDGAARLLADRLPAPLGFFLLQADLTAVAPGYLEPAVAGELALLSTPEGQGPATIYRFSAASVRAALDAGQSADSILEFLARYSATEVPQPLSYLIQDTAARHGVLRAGSMAGYLRSDDEAALAELLADPRAAALGLHRIAPTVLVSRAGAKELVAALRELGYAPQLEETGLKLAGGKSAPDGRSAGWRPGRTPEGTRSAAIPGGAARAAEVFPVRVNPWVLGAEELEQQLARLRGAAQPGTGDSESSPLIGLETLRRAIKLKAKVKIGFVDQRGEQRVDIVQPLSVTGGRVRVFDPDHETERVVSIHRVMDVEILEGNPHD